MTWHHNGVTAERCRVEYGNGMLLIKAPREWRRYSLRGGVADMNEGIIVRFRTMVIARTSVLTGQVLGSLIRAFITVALVVAVALAPGFHPTATPVGWLGAAGIIR